VTKRFQFDEWTYQVDEYLLTHSEGSTIQLEPRLGRLLELFCEHPGDVLSRDQIIEQIWAPRIVSEESLTVAISQLRRHLRQTDTSDLIKTVPGRGYAWKPETSLLNADSKNRPISRRSYLWLTAACAGVFVILAGLFWPLTQVKHRATVHAPHMERLSRAASLLEGNKDIDKAIGLYRQVLSDGPHAQAYLGLAQAKLARISPNEIPAHADELIGLLERAVAEEPELSEARWLLGMIYFYGHWDFKQARTMLVDEFDSGNRSPAFLQQFSEVMLALGEAEWVERAIDELRQNNPEYYSEPLLAWLYLLLGDTQAAQTEIKRIIDAEPANYEMHVSAQQVAYHAKDMDMSWSHLRALLELADVPASTRSELQQTYEREGLPGVHKLLMENPVSDKLGHYRPPMSRARHAVIAGENKQAIEFIRQAMQERQWEVLWLLVDPHYSSLHGEPEFASLVKEFQMLTNSG